MRRRHRALTVVVAAALAAAGFAAIASASDHADPAFDAPVRTAAGLTGLFFFPDGDDMILVLGVTPGLRTGPPYAVEPYEFRVAIDLHSEVSYDDPQDLARYGGTIVDPSGLGPDVVFRVRFDDQGNLADHGIRGLPDPRQVRLWAGVRDDPFIFPRFFKANVIAAVFAIPKSQFPAGQEDFVLWGTMLRDGEQVDHVGRSNRTQNGRYEFLNTVPVAEQAAALHETGHQRDDLARFLNRCNLLGGSPYQLFHLVFQLRPYDLANPDVMIYTTRFPPGYPNGRRLTDDVVLLTCQTGDCVLMELAHTEGQDWPRQTTNDKEFLAGFPYLAAPWPAQPPPESTGWFSLCVLLWIVGILLLLFLASYVWFAIGWWRQRKWRKQYPDLAPQNR